MFESLPQSVQDIMDWDWSKFDPYFNKPCLCGQCGTEMQIWCSNDEEYRCKKCKSVYDRVSALESTIDEIREEVNDLIADIGTKTGGLFFTKVGDESKIEIVCGDIRKLISIVNFPT